MNRFFLRPVHTWGFCGESATYYRVLPRGKRLRERKPQAWERGLDLASSFLLASV